jgi:HK97 family phage portal protein
MLDRVKAAILRAVSGSVPGAAPVGAWRGGWYPVVRESYTGAWQQNVTLTADSVLSYAPVYACVTLIAQDIAKMRLRLVEQDDDAGDVWLPTTNPAYSPVLRKPNRYQTVVKFKEQWMLSKLIHGNTYALKQRDARGVVSALYILAPMHVMPLVTTDGAVYYELTRDNLSGLGFEGDARVVVPASEIIHDACCCIFHPLVGVSPIFACGVSALQGLKIQDTSTTFFSNGSNPGGVLTAPGAISDEAAGRLKAYWDSNFSGANIGKVAVLGDGLKYEAMSVNAVDAQLVDQLQMSATFICSCFHVPPFMVGFKDETGGQETAEQKIQRYYSQCLQSHVANFETCLDEGLELPAYLGTEFDVDDLIWMDTTTRTKAASEAIGAGALSPDEARAKYFGLGTVKGGDTPYMQQQYFALAALAQRDSEQPFAKTTPPVPATPALPPPDDATVAAAAAKDFYDFCVALEAKTYAA